MIAPLATITHSRRPWAEYGMFLVIPQQPVMHVPTQPTWSP